MSGHNILVAEDETNDQMLLQFAFHKAHTGDKLHVVRYGDEVIDYLIGCGGYEDRKDFPFPDLLVLDLKLPGKDGLGVLTDIRSKPEWLKLPVHVLSGSTNPADAERALQLGATSYMAKPKDFTEWVRMALLLHGWQPRP